MLTGDDIRRLRIQAGLSQKRLAELIQRTERTIQNWEVGKGGPNLKEYCDICSHCNVKAGEFLTELEKRQLAEQNQTEDKE